MLDAITLGLTAVFTAGLLAALSRPASADPGGRVMHKININNKAEVIGEEGKALLFALRDNHIFLPSACGGKGACGQCRVTAVSGFNDPLNAKEMFHIPQEEREKNIRLACQHILKNDVEISIPEYLLCTKQYRAKVLKIEELTYDIRGLTLEILDPEGITFKAGQFIQFEVPVYELTKETVYRAYSLASPPSSHHRIELEIRFVPNGISTTYIHKYLKEGDLVTINGPFGMFHLHEDSNRDIMFIAGSTGLSPVRSILLDMKDRGINRKAQFFFGAVSKRDLFQVEEMQQLEQEMPGFKFIPALSKPEPDDNWEGETGLITEVAARYITDSSNLEAYLCGSPAMINACIKMLKGKGIPEDRIYYDRFS